MYLRIWYPKKPIHHNSICGRGLNVGINNPNLERLTGLLLFWMNLMSYKSVKRLKSITIMIKKCCIH